MSLLAELKRDHREARVARSVEITKILVTILGDLETVSKRHGDPITDSVIIKKLKKTISTNLEIIDLNVENADSLVFENEFLAQYLPPQLTSEQLTEILSEVLFNNIGEAMKYLATNNAGEYDGSVARKVILEILK